MHSRDTSCCRANKRSQLGVAYCFLRNVEHRLQAIRDEQTQLLPTNALDRARGRVRHGIRGLREFDCRRWTRIARSSRTRSSR